MSKATLTVDDSVLQVLKKARTAGTLLQLTGQLARPLYEAVNKVLLAAGGKWDRKQKAHVFTENAGDIINDIITTGTVTNTKKLYDLFETPAAVAAKMVNVALLFKGAEVLEPSAGNGRLIEAIGNTRVPLKRLDFCEIQPKCALKVAEQFPKSSFVRDDFMDLSCDVKYDRIIANPPFSRSQDVVHALKMWDHLKSGGRLVVLTSPGWQYRETQRHCLWRTLVQRFFSRIEELPTNTFPDTPIRTMLCVLYKP